MNEHLERHGMTNFERSVLYHKYFSTVLRVYMMSVSQLQLQALHRHLLDAVYLLVWARRLLQLAVR